MTNITTNISLCNFHSALTAPFGGADTHDREGNPIPSTSGKSWTFTLHNSARNTHLTFRSRRPKGWTIESPVLIDLMVGTDNTSDFAFIGSVSNGVFKTSPKTKVTGDQLATASRTMAWLMTLTSQPSALEIKAAAKCCRCAKKLTNPDSIDDGLGPICRSKMNESKVSKG